ncbi:hypothetical protein D3C76_816000 [compost metagenome]
MGAASGANTGVACAINFDACSNLQQPSSIALLKHTTMPMMVHTCGIIARKPMVLLLLSAALMLLMISGVHTAIIASVLTRQKYTRLNISTVGESISRSRLPGPSPVVWLEGELSAARACCRCCLSSRLSQRACCGVSFR